MSKPKCAIYKRVSKAVQAKEGFSLEAQENLLINLVKSEWDYDVLEEPGRSGENLSKRAVITKILDDIDDGKYQAIAVTEQDRLSRNPEDMFYIKKVLRDNNAKIITLHQTFDPKNDDDEFVSDLYGLLARRENRERVKRSKRARIVSARNGNYPHGLVPFGYKKVDKKPVIDEENRKIYDMICDWSLQGIGTSKIAIKLENMGIPSVCTIRNKYKKKKFKWVGKVVLDILKNPAYMGIISYKRIEVKIPPLISKEKWNLIQENLKKNYNGSSRNTKHFYLLRSLLKCKKCGRTLYGIWKSKKRHFAYACLSRIPMPYNRYCGLKNMPLFKTEEIVWSKIKELVSESNKLREAIKTKQSNLFVDDTLSTVGLEKINKQIKEKEDMKSGIIRLQALSKTVSVDEFDKEIAKIDVEIKELEREKKDILNKIQKVITAEQNIKKIEDVMIHVRQRIDSFTKEEKREFLALIIDKIIVDYDIQAEVHTLEIEGKIPLFDDISYSEIKTNDCRQLCYSDPDRDYRRRF